MLASARSFCRFSRKPGGHVRRYSSALNAVRPVLRDLKIGGAMPKMQVDRAARRRPGKVLEQSLSSFERQEAV
jgi:hypothetical protein